MAPSPSGDRPDRMLAMLGNLRTAPVERRSGLRRSLFAMLLTGVALSAAAAMANEEPTYQAVSSRPDYELRAYAPYVVAEVEVTGTQESAGNAGFRLLAAYIFGENRSRESIAMTAPVTTARSQKIAMTAPVIERAAGKGAYSVQFTMPAGYTLASLPEPKDRRVQLREVSARRVAVRRYRGGWSESRYQAELRVLEQALRRDGLAFVGEPLWARFNSPFSLPFLRRNEIWLELAPAR